MEEKKTLKETIQEIAFEIKESGATEWETLKVIKEIEQMQGTQNQLRKKATEILEKINEQAAKNFKSFERLKVYTSAEKKEPFDRGNIVKSLLKETSISRHIAEKIGNEVETKIKDMKINEITTQMIRELVNVKLLEYGHENIRTEYVRIGMPMYEVKKKLEENNFENKEILLEYNWLATIPKKAKELHFEGIIKINHPEDYSTKLFAKTLFIDDEKEEMAKKANEEDKKLTTPLCLTGLNHTKTMKSTERKKLQKAKELCKIFEITNKKRNAELELFSDYEWTNKEQRTDYIKNAYAIIKANQENNVFEISVAIDNKFKTKLLKDFEKITIINNSKTRTIKVGNIIAQTQSNTILQTTTINLETLKNKNEKNFFEKLDETITTIEELCKTKKTLLTKRKNQNKEEIENSAIGIGLTGIVKTTKEISEENPHKTLETIITQIQKKGFFVYYEPNNTENKEHALEILAKTQEKIKKSFGITWKANNVKEAEELIENSTAIELIQTK
ncbi:MAG: ATP cone domain-containing protein [Candidatus Diapherotrites archaeon]